MSLSRWPDDGDPNGDAMTTPMAGRWPDDGSSASTSTSSSASTDLVGGNQQDPGASPRVVAIPSIRAPREERPRHSRPFEAKKWPGTYEDYIKSPQWRARRDVALRLAKWRCAKCNRKDRLEVHHNTYERMGCELAKDLDVLCAVCHEGHHVDEQQKVNRIYLSVVSDILRREKFTTMSDLMEAVKSACARQRIPYDDPSVWKAVRLADANRHGVVGAPAPKFRVTDHDIRSGRPLTQAETIDCLRNLGIVVSSHEMPQSDANHEARVREQAREIREGEYAASRRPSVIGLGRFAVVRS